MSKKKIKAVLYARISTTNEDQILSYHQQMKYKNDSYNIVKVFNDQQSGKNIKDRKGFNDMLDFLGISIKYFKDDYVMEIREKTNIEVIITSSTSRLCRNLEDGIRLLKILHKAGIRVLFLDLNRYSDDENIDQILKIHFQMDEYYSKDVSRKVKYGMDRRKREGYILTNSRLFGYDLKEGRLIQNSDSITVRNIFEDYIYNGLSTRKLSLKYNKSLSTINSMLKNPKYASLMAYGVKEHGLNNLEQLDIIESDKIEGIITKEEFFKCIDIRNSRINGDRNKGLKNNIYSLSGKIKCQCGKSFHFHSKNRWVCSGKSKKSTNCKIPMVTENKILNYLNSKYGIRAIRNTLNLRLNAEIEFLLHENDDKEDIYKSKLEELNKEKERLLNVYIKGIISEEVFINKNTNIEASIKEIELLLKNQLEKDKRLKELESLRNKYIDILQMYEDILNSNEPKKIFNHITQINVVEGTEIDFKANPVSINKVSKIESVYFKEFEATNKYFGNFVVDEVC